MGFIIECKLNTPDFRKRLGKLILLNQEEQEQLMFVWIQQDKLSLKQFSKMLEVITKYRVKRNDYKD